MIKIKPSMLPSANTCMRMAIASQYPELIQDTGFKISTVKKTGAYALVGIGVHSAINYMLSQKINNEGYQPNIPEQKGIENYEKESQKYEEIVYDTGTKNLGDGKLQVERISKVFQKEMLPKLSFPKNANPDDHLEVKMERHIKEGFKLSGIVDVITIKSIIDIKTGKTVKPYQTQLGGYGLLKGKDNFEKFFLQNYPRTTLKKPYPGTVIVEYEKMFCMGEAWNTITRIIDSIEKFKKKPNPSYFHANPSSYLCSVKYCKAFGTKFCEYHK